MPPRLNNGFSAFIRPCGRHAGASLRRALLLVLGLASLARAGNISGIVYGPGRGTTLAGVTVSAYADTALVGSTTTGAGGVYMLGGLSAGAYRVEYFDPGGTYARAFYQDQPHFWSATLVTVGATSAATGIDAVMTYATPSPAWVGASDGAYTDRIRVIWRTVPGARYTRIFRSTTPTGPKTTMTGWSAALSFTDTDVVPGKTYYYFVRAAVGAAGQRPSAYGIADPGYRKLAEPRGVWTSIGKYTDRVTLSWPLVRGAVWYRVFRAATATGAKTPLGPWQRAGFLHDRTAVPGKTYHYFIQAAVSSTGWRHSSFSAVRSGYRKLDEPAGVWTSSGEYTDRVAVSWQPVTGASTYRVFRADTASGPKTPLGPWQAARFFLDRTATPGRTHFYFVQAAVGATGWRHSSFSIFRTGWRALAAPASVVASDGRHTGLVAITWTPVTGATHYRVYRAASPDGPKTLLGPWRAGTTYYNYSATPGVTYYYFIRAATSATGARPGGFSAGNPGHRALPAPTGLWASPGFYTDRIAVAWQTVPGAGAYRVYRAATADGDRTPLGDWQSATFFMDDTAHPGKPCFYFVQAAVNHSGWRNSTFSAPRSGYRKLRPPADVVASDGQYAGKTTVSWSAVAGATHYRVYRADSPTGTRIALGPWRAATSYDNFSGAPGLVYCYFVRAATDAGGTRPSEFSACDPGYRTLYTPTDLSATDGQYTERVAVAWQAVDGASHYRVYRSETAAGPRTPMGVWQTSTAYDDTTAVPGRSYFYAVQAAAGPAGEQPSGTSASTPGHRALAAPTGLWTSAGKYTDRVAVSWQAVAGANFYRVFRAESATGPLMPLSDWQAPVFFLDETAHPGKTYFYFIQAAVSSTGWRAGARGAGRSGWRALAAPSGIAVLEDSNSNGVIIAWQTVDGASHYRVSRADTPTDDPQPLGAWQTGSSYHDLTARPGTLYYYAVQGAVNASGARAGARGFGLRRPDDAAVAWHVDASRPDDSGNGGAWATALKTLQVAVTLAADGDTIWVTNGLYAPITTGGKVLFIASVNGAAATVIDGQGTERCATLGASGGNTNTVLSGFTLVNGSADYGGAAYGGTLEGCVLASSRADFDGGGAFGGVLNNCLVRDNTANRGGGVFGGTLNNCTVTRNRAQAGGGIHGGRLANCIVWGNTNTDHLVDNHADATFHASCTTPLPASGTGNLAADPLFVDAAQGNWRLSPSSPCIDAGDHARVVGDTDLDRRARIQDGTVDMGAYEYVPPGGAPGEASATTVNAPATATALVAVPHAWLEHYRLVPHPDTATTRLSESGAMTAADYEAAALADADGDGFAAWQEYVAGSDPTNAASYLKVHIGVADGRPRLSWTPDLGDARRYTLEGKTTLAEPAWTSPPPAGARFFRVRVELP